MSLESDYVKSIDNAEHWRDLALEFGKSWEDPMSDTPMDIVGEQIRTATAMATMEYARATTLLQEMQK